MNRDESLALYDEKERDPSKRREKWNAWARERLAEKEALEQSGEWEDYYIKEKWENEAQVDFMGHTFEQAVDFSKFIFPADVDFEKVEFKQKADFSFAKFKGNGLFKEAIFHSTAEFSLARFDSHILFGDAVFHKSVYFFGTFFGDQNISPLFARSVFKQTNFKNYASFYKSQFYTKISDFQAMQAERHFSLDEATFHHCVPDFVQAHFQEAPLLEHFKIPLKRPANTTEEEKKELPARYRALKRLALQGHDHEREQDFFAAELLSLRGVEDFPRGKGAERYWGGKFYQWLSDFGRSAFIPLRLWLITIALSFSIYAFDHWLNLTVNIWGWFIVALIVGIWGMIMVYFVPVKRMRMMLVLLASTLFLLLPLWATASCVSGSKDNSALTEAMLLSLKNAFVALPINMNERTNQLYACLYGVEKSPLSGTVSTPIIPDGVATLGIVQTLFSAVVIFLFLLAVRAKFRIK